MCVCSAETTLVSVHFEAIATSARTCKYKFALAHAMGLILLLGGDVEYNPGPSKQWQRRQAKKQWYKTQKDDILARQKLQYAQEPQPKKDASKTDYEARRQRKRAASRVHYEANPVPQLVASQKAMLQTQSQRRQLLEHTMSQIQSQNCFLGKLYC